MILASVLAFKNKNRALKYGGYGNRSYSEMYCHLLKCLLSNNCSNKRPPGWLSIASMPDTVYCSFFPGRGSGAQHPQMVGVLHHLLGWDGGITAEPSLVILARLTCSPSGCCNTLHPLTYCVVCFISWVIFVLLFLIVSVCETRDYLCVHCCVPHTVTGTGSHSVNSHRSKREIMPLAQDYAASKWKEYNLSPGYLWILW
jgi:hypothetical protein